MSNYIHVKLEKFKRGRSPSLHLGKEGDFAWNHSATYFSSINLQILAEILKLMRYSLLWMAYNSLYDTKHCVLYLVDTLLTSQCISLENSIQFLLLKEKIIVRWRGPKRGRFPLLEGRLMLRREMGTKRGSLSPKEGDLTCMNYTRAKQINISVMCAKHIFLRKFTLWQTMLW